MAQFGKYFTYNGHSSQEFNLMLASFDEVEEYTTGMDRDIQRGDMNRYRFKPNHMGTVYSAPLEFEVTFIKDMCNGADLEFTRSEYRAIADWLTEPEYPSLYHMTDYEEDWADEEEDYFGVFSNIENHAYGEVIGITATFTCDSPFAWSPQRVITIIPEGISQEQFSHDMEVWGGDWDTAITSTGTIAHTFNVDADVEYTHPHMIIHPITNSEITIRNETEGRELVFTPKVANNTIIIDCDKLTLTNTINHFIPMSDLSIEDPATIYWPRFVKGENQITITGDVIAVIKYREARKVGAY